MHKNAVSVDISTYMYMYNVYTYALVSNIDAIVVSVRLFYCRILQSGQYVPVSAGLRPHAATCCAAESLP